MSDKIDIHAFELRVRESEGADVGLALGCNQQETKDEANHHLKIIKTFLVKIHTILEGTSEGWTSNKRAIA